MTTTINYANRFGEAVLSPASSYGPITGIRSANLPPELSISLAEAEQLVLITENRRMQVIFPYPPGRNPRAHVLHHTGPSTVAVCKVEMRSAISPEEARSELARPSPVMC